MTPAQRRLVATLVAQLALGLLAMTLCIPSMQEWSTLLDGPQSTVQLTFSGFVLAYGGMQLVYGPLSDRIGRKPVLLAGVLLAGVASVLAALATSLPQLVAARVLQGAGCAAGMVIGRALVQDLFEGPDRTRVMAYVGMTMGLCPPLATVIGGQLHVRLGWQANFVLTALLALAAGIAAWRGLPARPPRARAAAAPPPTGLWQAYARLAREPAFLLHVVILGMTTATFYAFLAGAPLVLRELGVGPGGVGFYIMCIPLAYIVGNYLTSRWVRGSGERSMMRIGQALILGGLSLLLAGGLAGLHHPLALVLPLVLLGAGHGFLVPPTLIGSVGVVPALAGAAAAVGGVSQQFLGALGGYVVGLFRHDDVIHLAGFMLSLSLCAALAQGVLHRRRDGPVPG
jgi:DHA1 family bicyclomycin/chloramphenicol resistance-like MFS transporter